MVAARWQLLALHVPDVRLEALLTPGVQDLGNGHLHPTTDSGTTQYEKGLRGTWQSC